MPDLPKVAFLTFWYSGGLVRLSSIAKKKQNHKTLRHKEANTHKRNTLAIRVSNKFTLAFLYITKCQIVTLILGAIRKNTDYGHPMKA